MRRHPANPLEPRRVRDFCCPLLLLPAYNFTGVEDTTMTLIPFPPKPEWQQKLERLRNESAKRRALIANASPGAIWDAVRAAIKVAERQGADRAEMETVFWERLRIGEDDGT
jgi:hypothetical protein